MTTTTLPARFDQIKTSVHIGHDDFDSSIFGRSSTLEFRLDGTHTNEEKSLLLLFSGAPHNVRYQSLKFDASATFFYC